MIVILTLLLSGKNAFVYQNGLYTFKEIKHNFIKCHSFTTKGETQEILSPGELLSKQNRCQRGNLTADTCQVEASEAYH